MNKPGEKAERLKGGVVGGSILQGVLKVGDKVEIRPGQLIRKDTQIVCRPLISKVISLQAEENDLLYAVPGGLIGAGLMIDPSISRNDRLVGHVMGPPGQLSDLYTETEIDYYLLRTLIGTKQETGQHQKIQKLSKGETLKLNVLSNETAGRVLEIIGDVLITHPHALEIHASGPDQPRVHRDQGEGGLQQAHQQQVEAHRVGSDHVRSQARHLISPLK